MEHEIVAEKIKNELKVTPTSEQTLLIEEMAKFIINSKSRDIMVINGYAGTGKTTIISAFSSALNKAGIKTVMLAPTGKAAKVISQYSKQKAYTIHKKIYKQKSALVDQFVLDRNLSTMTYFIVDESSMINDSSYESMFGSGNLLSDLLQYVSEGKGCRLVIVGDKAQLPPVGRYESPALDYSTMSNMTDNLSYQTLSKVVRQQAESTILRNATTIRTLIENHIEEFPKFKVGMPDFRAITPSDFIDEVESAYGKYGNDQVIVITRSNKQARMLNELIRHRIFYMDEELSSGDLIMVVKNNYGYSDKEKEIDFIANGDTAKVRRLRRYEEQYGKRFVTATLEFPDYDDFELECKLILDTLATDAPALTREQSKELFFKVEQDYMEIGNKRERYKKIKEDSYITAMQIKFAYAITCHKAQGGQWDCVFIDRMLFGDEDISIEWLRWLYTAVTRATKEVVLINFDDRFIDAR